MKSKLTNFIGIILIVILVLLTLSLIATTIYCWITYGGKPIGEVPTWALWFMWRRK